MKRYAIKIKNKFNILLGSRFLAATLFLSLVSSCDMRLKPEPPNHIIIRIYSLSNSPDHFVISKKIREDGKIVYRYRVMTVGKSLIEKTSVFDDVCEIKDDNPRIDIKPNSYNGCTEIYLPDNTIINEED